MKIIRLFIQMIICYSAVLGQTTVQFPEITNNDLSDCEIVTSKYYKGESLWGLINGGADVYLEYGFDKLLFQEVKWKNKNFRVEIYKMKSPESAFGIFSISKFRCSNNGFNNELICITPYQVQGCAGDFYISIANEVGDSLTQESTLDIYELVNNQIENSEPQIPSKIKNNFDRENFSNVKFIAGPLGLQNGFPNWSSLFENIENFSIYINESRIEEEPISIAEVKIENNNELNLFIKNAESSKETLHIEKLENGNIFIIEGKISEDELKNIIE